MWHILETEGRPLGLKQNEQRKWGRKDRQGYHQKFEICSGFSGKFLEGFNQKYLCMCACMPMTKGKSALLHFLTITLVAVHTMCYRRSQDGGRKTIWEALWIVKAKDKDESEFSFHSRDIKKKWSDSGYVLKGELTDLTKWIGCKM